MNYDLWTELTEKRNLLNICISELKESGTKCAECEHKYKIALRKEMFALHEKNGVAWSACEALANGDTERNNVASLRISRDIEKAKHEVIREKINGLKLECRIIENQLNKEWSR